jgi:hypothetical protein
MDSPIAPAWAPDLSEGIVVDPYPVELDRGARRIYVRMTVDHRDRILDFALVLEVLEDDEWQPIARADCRHDSIHIDHLDRQGEVVRKQTDWAVHLLGGYR